MEERSYLFVVILAFIWGISNLDRLFEIHRRPAPKLPLYIYRNVTFSGHSAIAIMCIADFFVFLIFPLEYSAIILFFQGLLAWGLIREAYKLSHHPLEHERRSEGTPIVEITKLGIRAPTTSRPVGHFVTSIMPEELLEWNRISDFKLYRPNKVRMHWWSIRINFHDGSKRYFEVPDIRRRELVDWLNTYLARFGKSSSVDAIKNYIAGSE